MSFTGRSPSVLLAEVHGSSGGEKSSLVLKQGKCTVVKQMSESCLPITQLHGQVLQPTVNFGYSAFARVSSRFEASTGTGESYLVTENMLFLGSMQRRISKF